MPSQQLQDPLVDAAQPIVPVDNEAPLGQSPTAQNLPEAEAVSTADGSNTTPTQTDERTAAPLKSDEAAQVSPAAAVSMVDSRANTEAAGGKTMGSETARSRDLSDVVRIDSNESISNKDSATSAADAETNGHSDNVTRVPHRPKAKQPAEGEDWDEKVEYDPPGLAITPMGGDAEFEAKPPDTTEAESKPEIETIMKQFKEGEQSVSEQIPSPNRSSLPAFQRPPRTSSLKSIPPTEGSAPATKSSNSVHRATAFGQNDTESSTKSATAPSLVSQPPLPEPDPEPDLPFDFHRFLEQLRHRTADPVARFLRSFLQEFGKRQWMVHEQIKIINDFLIFIGNRMAQCEVWRQVSDAEYENAREGMEKLVMNRLYTQTFSPEIPALDHSRARRRASPNTQGVGRRGQHQEDVERDEVLAQKVRIYGWLREEHLDIKPLNEKGRKFLRLAQQELLKITSYRAPRDKVICVLNCCKVLFGYLRNANTDQSADAFIPLLIFTVLKANPDHLVSNVQYILRFRNQEKLSGESGYYMSSLLGAVQFIENLDRTQLTVSDDEFEKNVEEAVSSIAERRSIEETRHSSKASPGIPISEKSGPSRPEVTPRSSLDAVSSLSQRSNLALSSRPTGPPLIEEQAPDDNDAVAGLLRSIQKPLTTIGRIFSDDTQGSSPASGRSPRQSPRPGSNTNQGRTATSPRPPPSLPPGAAQEAQRARGDADVAVARQASADSAEAHRRITEEHKTVVETLQGMFPDLDREVISDVVRMKQGRVGLAVDACLALSH